MIRRFLTWVVTIGLVVGIWQHQTIVDWWVLRNYEPSQEVLNLTKSINLTDKGKKIFYLAQPQVASKSEFSTQCPSGENKKSLVLGCYYNAQAYILNVTEPKLTDVMSVTAAHELLHAAYDRLDSDKRKRIDAEIKDYYPKIKDVNFLALIKEYQRSEPGQLLNELHSLLPTQVEKLPSGLDKYYREYFESRAKIVSKYNNYKAVFESLNAKREQLTSRAAILRSQIDTLKVEAELSIVEANTLSKRIQRFRDQGKTEESNKLVPAQNQAASNANSLIAQIRSATLEHNSLISQINELALQQQDLQNALDSTSLEPVSPQAQ